MTATSVAETAGVGEVLKRNLRQNGILIAFIVVFGVAAVLNPNFLSGGNITNLVLQYSYILILAMGMLLVIVAAQIDLSVGSVVALTGAVSAVLVIKNGMPWWVGVLAALGVGLLVGAWQGFWVAFVGIPGFIVTLGGMLLFRGLTYLVLNSISLSPFGGAYYDIANGFQNGLLGGYGVDNFTMLVFALGGLAFVYLQWRTRQGRLRYKQQVDGLPLFIGKQVVIFAVLMWFGYQLATSRGLPNVLVLLVILIIIYTLVSQKTVFGRHVFAIGGNLNAAKLSGVRVRRINFWVFVNMGLLAAVAGIVYSSRMNAAQPNAGDGVELDAIAACFIGGASTTGGIGRIGGAMIGGMIMAVMSNIMQLMGWPQPTQKVARGLVLLLAVAFDLWNRRRSETAA
ncbi:MAG: sugar ABC transporter permease [Propionicimonas sp.]|uniref:multiple monosaccharide ABC transporter permease n=1 Tax=Propionicimonas sp. TaxID=1955623 RepID=UPI003D0B5F1D